MKSTRIFLFTVLIAALLTGCGNEYYVAYKPPVLPVIITINSFGELSVSWEGSIQLPIGTISYGLSRSTTLINQKNAEWDGVLIVNVNGKANVYDLKGNEDISVKFESGYYEQLEFRKEGKNWYFEATRVNNPLFAEVNLVNEHCESIDFYVDRQKLIDAMPAGSNNTFMIKAGYHETQACIAGTQSCGDSVTVDWEGSNTHSILRSTSCNETNPNGNEGISNYTCNKPVYMSNISPSNPTLKPKEKYTAVLTFYNPNDCDVRNLKFTLGWSNDLAGVSGFSIPIIYANRYEQVSIKLTAPTNEGDGYFTFYNMDSSLCNGLCTPVFIYANVKKK